MLRRRSLVPLLFSVFFFVFLCCSFAFLLVLFLLKSENRAQATKATQKCTRNQYKKRPSKRQEKKLSRREGERERVREGERERGARLTEASAMCKLQCPIPFSNHFCSHSGQSQKKELKNSNAFWPLCESDQYFNFTADNTIKKRRSFKCFIH